MKKKALKYIIAFLLTILIFNLLLFITSLFPSSIIKQNVEESSKTLLEENNWHYLFKFSIVQIDNCTDTFMINIAYSIDNTNPLYSYMSARKNYNKEITENEWEDFSGNLKTLSSGSEISEDFDPAGELSAFLNGDINTSVTYTRYWHRIFSFS